MLLLPTHCVPLCLCCSPFVSPVTWSPLSWAVSASWDCITAIFLSTTSGKSTYNNGQHPHVLCEECVGLQRLPIHSLTLNQTAAVTVLSGLEAVTQHRSGISDRLPNHPQQTTKENTSHTDEPQHGQHTAICGFLSVLVQQEDHHWSWANKLSG